MFTAEGIRIVASPPQAPRATDDLLTSTVTLRLELLDRLLIIDEQHLRRVLTEYLTHNPSGAVPGLPPSDARVGGILAGPEVTAEDLVYLFFPDTDAGRGAGHGYLARIATRLATGRPELSPAATSGQAAAIAASGSVPWEQLRDDLERIAHPVLCAAGIRDVMIPAITAFIAVQHLPQATLVGYSDAGRRLPLPTCHRFRHPGHRPSSPTDAQLHGPLCRTPPITRKGPSMTQHSMFTIETVSPKIRRVTFSNPPVNVVGADTVAQLLDVVDELSRDEQVQVVIFDSGTPGYFYNHADLGQVPELLALNGADGTPTWVDLVTRLTSAPFISIASIRGRTRGGGDEIALAFDLRYASREQAFFCQPEVAIGIVPGGGGSDRLARLLGRDRALEAILTGQDYDADRAEQYGWVTRTVPDAELDDFVDAVAARIASFDKASVLGAKAQINRSTLPPVADLRASWARVRGVGHLAGIPGARAPARQGHRRDRPRGDRAQPGPLRRPHQPAGLAATGSTSPLPPSCQEEIHARHRHDRPQGRCTHPQPPHPRTAAPSRQSDVSTGSCLVPEHPSNHGANINMHGQTVTAEGSEPWP